jgi:hypothetical protein
VHCLPVRFSVRTSDLACINHFGLTLLGDNVSYLSRKRHLADKSALSEIESREVTSTARKRGGAEPVEGALGMANCLCRGAPVNSVTTGVDDDESGELAS